MTMLTNTSRFASGAPTIRRSFAVFLARFGRHIDRWIAGMIARRERQAALFALHRLDDRLLRDVGLYRSQIDSALSETAAARMRMQRQLRSL
jgi:uncharacterized protein YjiS (DUF1127 family)